MALTPISWPPSQVWEGDDGDWSSFTLRVGSPAQTLRVLPSTAGQQTWAVSPRGCPLTNGGNLIIPGCSEARGGLFDAALSSSWHPLGNFTLGLELNLGYNDSASYGLDTVALGFSDSFGGPAIKSQVVAALATHDRYLGVFGLGHQGTNISNFSDPHPSFLSGMKDGSLIPSLSWGYTAGAKYRSKGVFGSLTFGGYDQSRFIPNNISFSLASDISRDLVVGLQSITSTSLNGSVMQQKSLLPKPVLIFIDSTTPFTYLPLDACKRFEETFGLSWNETAGMYWVNDTLHEQLLSLNVNVTFTIGDTTAGGATVQIDLPYASFDLEVKYPFALNTMRYFPLQRAVDDSQYTLGRAFLQEAYVITDYERSNFSVSQCRFEDGVPAQLVTIRSATETLVPIPSPTATPDRSRRLVVLGTSIGSAVLVLLFTIASIFLVRRRRRRARQQADLGLSHRSAGPQELVQETRPSSVISSAQMIDDNSNIVLFREMPDTGLAELLDELLRQTSPSAPGHESRRSSGVFPQVVHELGTHRSSQITLSMRAPSYGPLCKVKEVPRKHYKDIVISDSTSTIPMVLALSAQHIDHVGQDDASIASSNLEAQIYASYLRKPLDLNRTLPPTPISESPQLSPAVAEFNR